MVSSPSAGMSIHGIPLAQVNAALLESLRANAVAESRQLDYKERLPGESDDDKRELLADVTAFANTAGGDLIYGVRERRDAQGAMGEPEAIVGLPGVNLDQAKLRLENVLRDCIDPRIPALTFHAIPRDPDPPCLVLRVPKSPYGLHMATYKGVSRFYGRGASGRFLLDWGQIRAGFLQAQTAEDRVRRFRLERVARVLAGETPIPTGPAPKVIFHALPLTPTDVWEQFQALNETDLVNVLRPLAGSPGNWRHTLDGFVMHANRSDPSRQAYSLCYRDGGIEAMSSGILEQDPRRGGFYGHHVEVSVIQAVTHYQRLWTLLGMTGPMMMALALSGVQGLKILVTADRASPIEEETFDRDVALIPEVIVHDLGERADRMLRPLFDVMWNGGGWSRSPWYNANGDRVQT